MTTPKCQILSLLFVFTILCFKKSLLTKKIFIHPFSGMLLNLYKRSQEAIYIVILIEVANWL